ncbi:MAG: hypothetical protein K2Q09_04795 [Phycisphaerales bacterium]|nr:hypothetical protein [Phycisphaerales bacterium]
MHFSITEHPVDPDERHLVTLLQIRTSDATLAFEKGLQVKETIENRGRLLGQQSQRTRCRAEHHDPKVMRFRHTTPDLQQNHQSEAIKSAGHRVLLIRKDEQITL